MRRRGPLFNQVRIFDVLLRQKEVFKEAFRKVSNAELDANTEGVVSRLVEQCGINVPLLHDENKHALTKETQVDVSRDPMRRFAYNSGPHYVAATEITFVIPFDGDAALFDVQPSTFTTNPPLGQTYSDELRLAYVVTDAQFDVEGEANRNIAQIKQYLDNMRPSAEQLKGELEQLGASLVERRKQERGAHSQIVAGLKTPIRIEERGPVAAPIRKEEPGPVAAPTPIYPPARRRAARKKREEEWDVFISHATEDKEAIARSLADALIAQGLRVWYDDFSLKLGDSLRRSIDRGLARSLFGVVILSPRFFEKHWPQQELNGLATREVDGEKVILPVWHNISAEEVRKNSPMLADRKAVHANEGLERVVQMILEVVKPD